MSGQTYGRLLFYLKLLCCAAVVGNAAGMIESMHADHDRVSLTDLFVLAASLATLSALALGGKHPRWEFWAGFTAGALCIVLASRGGKAHNVMTLEGYKSNHMIATKEEILLGAAKYESCTCTECVSRYTDGLAWHQLETTRSVLGLCAACLTGTATALLGTAKRKWDAGTSGAGP